MSRPEVPGEWVQRCDLVLTALPRCRAEAACAEPDEVLAFEALGEPYFLAGWATTSWGS